MLPHRLLLTAFVEPNFVLIHVFDVGVVQVTSHQLVDTSLRLVWVPPRSVARRSPPLRYLILEITVKSELAAIVLKVPALDDCVAKRLG